MPDVYQFTCTGTAFGSSPLCFALSAPRTTYLAFPAPCPGLAGRGQRCGSGRGGGSGGTVSNSSSRVDRLGRRRRRRRPGTELLGPLTASPSPSIGEHDAMESMDDASQAGSCVSEGRGEGPIASSGQEGTSSSQDQDYDPIGARDGLEDSSSPAASSPSSSLSVPSGSATAGGRVAGRNFDVPTRQRGLDFTAGGENVDNTGTGTGTGIPSYSERPSGRIKLKWGIDIDLQVPVLVEALLKGPWDPNDQIWRSQLDMAEEVIARSGGVVFVEQLAPILNPRQGPLRRGSSHDRMSGRDEALVLRALLDLNGAPEVTSDGDILYIFPELAEKGRVRQAARGAAEAVDVATKDVKARPEVLQFEEVPGLLESLPKMQQDGVKAVIGFFQRTALSGFALFLSICLLLSQLIFGGWPLWLASGPAYLLWVGLDDTLKRSRYTSARDRDRWRAQWADVCRGDEEDVWRTRAAARRRAKQLSDEGM